MEQDYLNSAIKQFEYYKSLGDKSFTQIPEDSLFWQPDPETNSIAIIVQHLWGNMLSRWTDFLTTDGEKEWRDRDGEFNQDTASAGQILEKWEAGWACLFDALNSLKAEDLGRIIYIRNMGHTVVEAINRQLCHYAYHVGQIVLLAKMIAKQDWASLSIPKGNSQVYNSEKFAQPKRKTHFTDAENK